MYVARGSGGPGRGRGMVVQEGTPNQHIDKFRTTRFDWTRGASLLATFRLRKGNGLYIYIICFYIIMYDINISYVELFK